MPPGLASWPCSFVLTGVFVRICTSCGTRYPNQSEFCPTDGARLVPVPEGGFIEDVDLSGERIFGDYIIRKKLGEGGMGAVYLAENVAIDQKIAIKVLHGEAAQSEELVQRFNREAKTISRLTHPNIIRVFIFGKTEKGLIYLAMEYVDGRPLRLAIEDAKHLDELRAISIMRQTLHALAEAHELGIVHRDLKPDNIMLTSFRGVEDYVKVLDFGIAKVKENEGPKQAKLTQAGVVYGTPEYLSPEQAQAKPLDGRSDLYSMGIILYEMIAGTVPYTGSTAVSILAAHVYDTPKPPSNVAQHRISLEMERVIMKAIAKDPAQRYQTAMDFLSDLEGIEEKAIGSKARKTTMLDATELSKIHEVSRAATRHSGEHNLSAAADAQKARKAAPKSMVSLDSGAVLKANQQIPVPAAANTKSLYALIAGLCILLVMAGVALALVLTGAV